jgi:FixJ family two-component response regulator
MPKTQPFVAIVDDETPIRRALVRLLRSAGQDAIQCVSGRAAGDAGLRA